jgi:acetyltransferase-like isoleucine patch superfamily enzyme
MVRADVPARTVVVGAPARHLRAVEEDELLEMWREDGR